MATSHPTFSKTWRKPAPDLARLRELLHYNRKTGLFVWNISPARAVRVGDIAGYVHHSGYRYIRVDGEKYGAHRLAWLYVRGEWPPYDIDHRNGVRSDNRIRNLRAATNGANCMNRRPYSVTSSGLKGVSKNKDGWIARIMINRESIYLGYFSSAEAAHAAYCEAAPRLHGKFARTA